MVETTKKNLEPRSILEIQPGMVGWSLAERGREERDGWFVSGCT